MQADLWGQFAHDPRDRAHAALRASDHDRDLVRGELPAVVDDLVATTAPVLAGGGPVVRPEELVAQAVRRYGSDRREALMGFLAPSLICVVIWALTTGPGGFFWPGFVIAGTAINLIQVLVRRQDIIDQHVRRLEKKQLRAIEKQQEQREPERPEPPDEDPA